MNSAGVLDEPYLTKRFKEAAGVMNIIGISDNQFTFDVINDKTTRLSYCVRGCVCNCARMEVRAFVSAYMHICMHACVHAEHAFVLEQLL